jgi:single-strand DNA-binding protein
MAVLKMGVAVNDRRKNPQSGEWEDFPNYIDVVVFGARGESISRFLTKGSKVAIEGKLRWSSWEDKESGAKRNKIEVVADDIEFMSSRGEGGGGGGGYSAPSAPSASPEPVLEDDIPF